ncbi:hypothetical protein CI102_14890 [Trichoderma harzianum]|nr:hypothetical protein CI102_14890 [Trichoderma harzianum]
MSDTMQVQGQMPHHRRLAANMAIKARGNSCTECRRRKQKCDQGRPCSNCVRRFPQPTCEYNIKRSNKRPASAGSPGSASKNVKVVLEGGYAHLNLSDIQDAILQVEGVVAASGIADGLSAAPVVAQGEVVSRSSHDQDASSHRSSAGSASDPFRVVVTDETGTLKPKSVFAMLRLILQARLKVTNRIVNDEWSIDGPQLMRALQQAAQPPAMIGGLDDQLRNLPMEPTRLNIELVRIRT